jgi:hypothetical protein
VYFVLTGIVATFVTPVVREYRLTAPRRSMKSTRSSGSTASSVGSFSGVARTTFAKRFSSGLARLKSSAPVPPVPIA